MQPRAWLVVFACTGFLSACTSSEPERESVEPGHQKMLILLKTIKDEISDNRYLGDAKARDLRNQLAQMPESTNEIEKAQLHYQLGEAEIRLGNEAKAISHYETALDLLPTQQGTDNATAIHFRLGVAYMRLGETQNCCLRNNPESCIFPIRAGGVHQKEEGSKKAIAHFRKVLEFAKIDSLPYMEALWLLNLAHMTLGTHPDGVPAPYRIPADAWASDEAFPRFRNIAPQLKLNTFSLAGGAIADDFDNDQYLDLIVSTFDPAGQIRYFRSNRDGTFADRTTEAGLKGIYGGLNILQADYNNDGHLDILVLRGGWNFEDGRHPNSLLRKQRRRDFHRRHL